MLNDDKSITTSTVALDGALSIYRRKFKLISLVLLIIGAIGLITYIVAGTLYEKEPLWVKFMLAFAVPFTLGLIGFITIIRLDRRAKTEGHKANCTFYSDCFFYNIENKPSEKFIYSDAVLKSENENYGYIYILSRAFVAVFSKDGLDCGELNAIRRKFRKTVPDGEEIAGLENYKGGEDI
ncbi:MAG: hypothetical protein HFK05_00675 [Clostridia bacterium]|nr:hypothetical protein [Clostridia bacterium]